jgi:hypothetical protein
MSGKTWEELWWVSYVVLAVWIVNGALIFYLLSQIDSIVNVQLYSFGLQFSKQWADSYWTTTRLMMVFLGLPMALSAAVFVAGFRKFRRKAKTIFAKRKTEPAQVTLKEKSSAFLKEKQPTDLAEKPLVISGEEPQPAPEDKQEPPSSIEKETESEEKPEPANEPEIGVITPEVIQTEQTNRETEVVETGKEPSPNADMGVMICCPTCGRVFNRPLVMLDFAGGTTHLVNVCPFCKNTLGEALDSRNDEKT